MKKHMEETSGNQIPITVDDIKKVPDIINNPDAVVKGSNTLAADRKTTIPSIRYIKTDTYSLNKKMKSLFKKLGYKFIGEVKFLSKEKAFYCYEKILK